METALRTLKDLQDDLEANSYRYTFEQKLELLANFIASDLQDVINAVDEGIDRISDLESEVDDLNEQIKELESEAL